MRLPGTVPKLLPVKSSNVAAIGYDYKNEILYVQFLSSDQKKHGSLYKYLKVPKLVYEKMLTAHSKGEFLNKYVKDKYHYYGWSGFGWKTEKTLQARAKQHKLYKQRWKSK